MRIARALVLITLATVARAQAQQTRRVLKPEDFAQIKSLGDPQLAPDGNWIAYTISTADLAKDKSDTDIWMISWDGTTNIRLTSTPESESNPRWSPDGKYLAFTSARQEGKGAQLWLLDRRGGEAQRLTQVKGGVAGFTWSPDASKLAFVITDADQDTASVEKPKPIVIDRYSFKSDATGYMNRKRDHIYLFDVATKQLDSLTTGDFDDSSPTWSPDGKWLAFSSKRQGDDPDRGNNADLYVMEAHKGATVRRLTTWSGADSGPVAWTPDSKWIAYYQGMEPKYSAYNQGMLALISPLGGEPRFLQKNFDRDLAGGRFSADGKYLYLTVTDDRLRYLARLDVAKDKLEKFAIAARAVNAFTMSKDGRIAVLVSMPKAPAEVYAFDGKDYRKLTSANDEFLAKIKLGAMAGIEFKTKDGVEPHAVIVKPADFQAGVKYPTLLRIHGGPNGQDAFEWSFEKQLFASNGYLVVSPNYRGSNGRGAEWKRAIFADWGNKEVVDVLAATDKVVEMGIADPNRLGIGGWSYGCITTDYTIATDPGRFKAATCGAGSALQLSMYGSDQYIVQYEQELGAPWKNKDLWLKLSWPFFQADRIKTPTLFLGGQLDFNVPLVGGEQMYQALKSLGVPTQLIVYPNEHHGVRRPTFVKDIHERYLAWYAKYLIPQAAAGGS